MPVHVLMYEAPEGVYLRKDAVLIIVHFISK